MSIMVKDKQLFKNYKKMWEKIESLTRKKFAGKLFYGNDGNKYIKTKKHLKTSLLQIFIIKKYLKKKYHANIYR